MIELEYITKFYGDRTAKRSEVPLINHIHEGLAIMKARGASDFAQRAFVMHPLFQADEDFKRHYKHFYPGVPTVVITLAIEYRNQANAWLSNKVVSINEVEGLPSFGPLEDVREMLIADKVQNYKDFLTYHRYSHEREAMLMLYFAVWLEHLGITKAEFERLCSVIDSNK